MTFNLVAGNIFTTPLLKEVDSLCLPVSTSVKRKNGKSVMSTSILRKAKSLFPGIDEVVGKLISEKGSVVEVVMDYVFYGNRVKIVSFPVRFEWWEHVDEKLVELSLRKLVDLTERERWKKVLVPSLGESEQTWKEKFRPLYEKYLDERFFVTTKR